MALTPAQRNNPHRMLHLASRARLTYLERSFLERQRAGEREEWWALGVVEETLADPRRGARLLKTFLVGASARDAGLDEEERGTWHRLWNGSAPHTPDTQALALAVFALRAPDLVDGLLAEGASFQTPLDPAFPFRNGWALGGAADGMRHTAWTAAFIQADQTVARCFFHMKEEVQARAHETLALLERQWSGDGGQPSQMLSLITERGAERGWLDHPTLTAWRDRLLDAGASPWPTPREPAGEDLVLHPHRGSALGGWLHALQWGHRCESETLQAWGLALLKSPAPKNLSLSRDAWVALARLPHPEPVIRTLVAQGLSPFVRAERRSFGNSYAPYVDNVDWGAWGDALTACVREKLTPPPSEDWIEKELALWGQQWNRQLRHNASDFAASPRGKEALKAWTGGWRLFLSFLPQHGTTSASDAVVRFLEHTPAWSTPAFPLTVVQMLERTGLLPTLFLSRGLLSHCVLAPDGNPFVERALSGREGSLVRDVLWDALITSKHIKDEAALRPQRANLERWSEGLSRDTLVQALTRALQQGSDGLPLARMLLSLGATADDTTAEKDHYAVFKSWASGWTRWNGNPAALTLPELTSVGWAPRKARSPKGDLLTSYARDYNLTQETQEYVRFLAYQGMGDIDELEAVPDWRDDTMKTYALTAVREARAQQVGDYLDEVARPGTRQRPRL